VARLRGPSEDDPIVIPEWLLDSVRCGIGAGDRLAFCEENGISPLQLFRFCVGIIPAPREWRLPVTVSDGR